MTEVGEALSRPPAALQAASEAALKRRGMLCLSLAGEDADSLIRRAEPCIHLADLVEIRLDSMRDPDIGPFAARFSVPILVSNRPQWEGGAFGGSEEERLGQLERALDAGAAYVDIELRTEAHLREALLAQVRARGAWGLVSWHDFTTTPESGALRAIFEQMRATAARSGKIVTTATGVQDSLRLLALLDAAASSHFPLSAFAMGAAGRISRLAGLYLGGHISYTFPEEAEATAPGQIPLGQLRALCDLFEKLP